LQLDIHNRGTGGAYQIVQSIQKNWALLSKENQNQILKESYEASTNLEDWENLRKFAEEQKNTPEIPPTKKT
jgi:outer membrane PBP1 activator LpoA protein